MTTAQGFTPDDRMFCIEHLTPEARERLGFYYCDKYGEWRHQDRAGHCGIDFCEYLHDAAILAEVVMELLGGNTITQQCILWHLYNASLYEFAVKGDPRVKSSSPSLFTAAAAALRKCKGGE